MPVSEETAKKIKELLETPTPLLDGLDRQRQFLARTYSTRKTCPWPDCTGSPNLFEAAPETWSFGETHSDRSYTCPYCKGGLVFLLPLFGGTWLWEVDRDRKPPAKE